METKISDQDLNLSMDDPELFRDKFSKFGIYSVENSLKLILPYSEIKITKQDKKKYSYHRIDHDSNIKTILITTHSEPLKIHLAPIGALHKPSQETKFMFLRFDHKVLVEKGHSVDLSVPCPIEIGVFRISDEKQTLLDSFSCEPIHSRFAIYGEADTGILCKYANILPDVSEPESYVYGTMKVSIKNDKQIDASVGKLVFPLGDLDVSYMDEKSTFNDLRATLKDTLGGLPPSVEITPITDNAKVGWKKSPTVFPKNESVFVMKEGFD